MKLSDEEILELHELLNGLVEKNLPPYKLKRLEDLLINCEEARHAYVSFMDMSSSLAHYAEEIVTDEDILDEDENDVESDNKLVRYFRPFLGVAALIVFTLTIVNFYNFNLESHEINQMTNGELFDDNSSSSISEKTAFAVFTHSVGLTWDQEADIKPVPGQTLASCSLNVESGLAQLEFIRGSTVILEGPVEFEIKGTNAGFLKNGKLRANVPPVAKGFAIDLPHGRLIDLGTEFGLHVHDGDSTEIYVYDGKVIYEGTSDSGESFTYEISKGEALFIDPYGYPRWVEMPSEPFMGTADLAHISMEQSQTRYASWVNLSEEISQLPETSLYFSFDNHTPWTRTLNDSFNRSNGAIIGCKWTEGRWHGKGALDFSMKNDQVRFDFPLEHSSVTLAAWIKLDQLKDYCAPIISSDSNNDGAVSWYINQNGKLVLELTVDSKPIKYESSVAFRKERLGRWIHLVTTLDPISKLVSHYINGRSFSREKIDINYPVTFGPCLLGNFANNSNQDYKRSISGKIDEFVLFKDAYSEIEVRRLFEVGTPYELPRSFGNSLP